MPVKKKIVFQINKLIQTRLIDGTKECSNDTINVSMT